MTIILHFLKTHVTGIPFPLFVNWIPLESKHPFRFENDSTDEIDSFNIISSSFNHCHPQPAPSLFCSASSSSHEMTMDMPIKVILNIIPITCSGLSPGKTHQTHHYEQSFIKSTTTSHLLIPFGMWSIHYSCPLSTMRTPTWRRISNFTWMVYQLEFTNFLVASRVIHSTPGSSQNPPLKQTT